MLGGAITILTILLVSNLPVANFSTSMLAISQYGESCDTHSQIESEFRQRNLTYSSSDGSGFVYSSDHSKAAYICSNDQIASGIYFFGFSTENEASRFYESLESLIVADYGESNLNFQSIPARLYLWSEGDPDGMRYAQTWQLEDREIYVNTSSADYWPNDASLGA